MTLFLLSLAGCGGDESYISSRSSATVPFSGVVEDGPISGAKVSLRDKEGTPYPLYDSQNHTNYEIKTDASGKFSLEVNAGLDPSALSVVAVGGVDSATGMDFHNIEMRCPYELFQGVVSPVTTLVSALNVQGFTYAEAKTRVHEWLALPDNINLMSSPATSLDLQRRTLLLSKIALELKTAQPLQGISLKTAMPGTSLLTDEGTCDPAVLSTLFPLSTDNEKIERISRLQELLEQLDTEINTPEDAFAIFKREEISQLFDKNFRERLELSPPFAENYQINIRVLTEKILLAAGEEVFLLVDPIPKRLFRYVFSTYMASDPTSSDPLKILSPQEKLLLDPLEFAKILTSGSVALENNPWIASLARSRVPNGVETPLLWDELPENDNQRRVAYFYGSDVSPHYRAEMLIGNVYDDFINDEILVQMVEGKANSGLINEANTIIETQIMQREQRAHAYRSLANAFIAFNKCDEAILALNKAESIYSEVLGSNYIANLVKTSNSYRKAGDLEAAEDLLAEIASYLETDSDYGRAIAGLQVLIDVYIADGDFDKAASQAQKMYEYSLQTPETATGNYMLRVRNLSECAKRYADLDHPGMVLEIYGVIQFLWHTYPKTITSTWAYVPDLIETLYRSGEKEASLVLLNKIPLTSMSGSTPRRTIAYCKIATHEALYGNLNTALSFADNVTINDRKIDLLTYFASNQSNSYIALSLINAGRYDEARQVLAMVETLLVSEDITKSNNLIKIRYGYVRLSGLYVLLGDRNKAKELLDIAQQVIGDDPYAITVKIDVALGYINIGEIETACTILESAKNTLIMIPDNENPYQEDAPPPIRSMEEAKTRLYQKLAKTFKIAGEKESALETVRKFVEWAKKINSEDVVDDAINRRKCDYLLSAATYFEDAGSHNEALASIMAAIEVVNKIAKTDKRLDGYIVVAVTYAAINEERLALDQANKIVLTSERNKAFQSLAKHYLNRDDFPETWVASIDSDGDGKPDFFNPLASADEITASGLILDDDSDGDGIVDTLDIRPLFKD